MLQAIKIICPRLQHASAFVEIPCLIIDRANFVLVNMGKLPLNGVRSPPKFIEQGAGHMPETMGDDVGITAR